MARERSGSWAVSVFEPKRRIPVERSKAELNAELNALIGQALEMAITLQQVANKLRANAKLIPSRKDFDSDSEWQYRPDINDNSAYPDAAKLIDDMRLARQAIHNLEFEEEQGGPKDTMTC
jgi:hypothetical protein